jgi:hypothetical protein
MRRCTWPSIRCMDPHPYQRRHHGRTTGARPLSRRRVSAATPGRGSRSERRVDAELELDRRRPARVGLGVDRRHHRIDVLVGVLVDAAQRRQVDRVGARDPGGGQGRRGVVDRDHRGAEPVALPGEAERPPERVVEDHDFRPDRSQRLPDRAASERHPVPVRRGELERAELVTPAVMALALARHHQVMLERARRGGEARLLVQVRADPAAAFGVEQRDVANDDTAASYIPRGGRTVHGPHFGGRRGASVLRSREPPRGH